MNRSQGLLKHRMSYILIVLALATSMLVVGGRPAYADEALSSDAAIASVSADSTASSLENQQAVQAAATEQEQDYAVSAGDSSAPDVTGEQDSSSGQAPSDDSSAITTDSTQNDTAEGSSEVDSTSSDSADSGSSASSSDVASANTEELVSDSADDEEVITSISNASSSSSSTLNGVDISGHNPGVNFAALKKAGTNFVIIKATEWNPEKKSYTSYNDYKSQADAALKQGLLIGFYHFFTSPNMTKNSSTKNGASITDQVNGFVNAISSYLNKGEQSPVLVLDWENTSYSNIESHTDWAKQWLDGVYNKTGVRPLIYMNWTCSNNYDWSKVKSDYKLWGAGYKNKNAGKSSYIKASASSDYGSWGAWGTPVMYQYSSTAHISGRGSNNNIDVNVFYGSKEDYVRLAQPAALESTSSTASALTHNAIYLITTLLNGSSSVSATSKNVQVGADTNKLAGYWRVENLGGGTYQFYSLATGQALAVSGSVKSGANVSTLDTESPTIWKLIKLKYGKGYALAPASNTSLRLDVAGGKLMTSGTNIGLYSSNKTPAQGFYFTKSSPLTEAWQGKNDALAGGIYKIQNALKSGLMLDIKGASTANSANAQVYASNDTMAQRFTISYVGNYLYTIQSKRSGKYLDVAGTSTANSANVQQYTKNSTLAQFWYIVKSGNGYIFLSAASGKALDVAGAKTANGTNVQQYTKNGTDAQRWILTKDAGLTAAAKAGKTVEPGIYKISSALSSSKVLDIAGASTSAGSNVQLYSSNGTQAQKFELVYQGNGLYMIRPANSGLYLETISSSNGANVRQNSKSSNSLRQMWYIEQDANGYSFKSAASTRSLDVTGSKTSNGTNIQVYTSASSKNQRWNLSDAQLLANGTYSFGNAASNGALVLDVAGASTKNSANVQGYQINASAAQRFVVTYLGDGIYTIKNKNSGLMLDVAGGSTKNSANVQQYKANGTDAQKWRLHVADNGDISFENVGSGKYLDLKGGKVANSQNIQQYTANGSKAQAWHPIAEADLPKAGSKLAKFVSNMAYYTEIANVGYDMGNRWAVYNGGETDCSALVITCLKKAGFATGDASYTGDMSSNLTARGWKRIAWNINDVKAGDILLNDSYHTCAVVFGSGTSSYIAQATIDENGNGWGGKAGDQTGTETNMKQVYTYKYGWNCILRYVG